MTLNLVPSQHAKLVKVGADSPRNTTRLLTQKIIIDFFVQSNSMKQQIINWSLK